MSSSSDVFCDTHYSYECGCEPAPLPASSLPPCVWVVVEIYSKSVRLNEGAATSPISGKAAIFQRPEVTQQVAARIIGVYPDERVARLACPDREGAEFLVERHQIWQKPEPTAAPEPDPVVRCILCSTPCAGTFCVPCQNERNRLMRERDEAIITEQVPASA